MRLAFIVIGPASSCTRMVKELLIDAGCYGDKTNQQTLDNTIPDDWDLMVFHRSVPHGRYYPSLREIERRFNRAGIRTKWIVVLRDWIPTIRSKMKRNHQFNLNSALVAVQEETYYIFAHMREFKPDYFLVNASNLKQSIEGLKAFCKLPLDETKIRDEDSKHYQNLSAMAW